MSTMAGFFCHEQETILYNKTRQDESKNIGSLPMEYIWKLLSMLPPIPDVPPPGAKQAFSEFLRTPKLESAKKRIGALIDKERLDGLRKS